MKKKSVGDLKKKKKKKKALGVKAEHSEGFVTSRLYLM